ncbi:MAG TPA: ATP-binding protein [Solirubrobacteraceae bacterium]|jgi:anti-sigma regulatory factor (Ser/Thr protein kinase)|nr:ATP-binding protein [Solirubrobacteraceae bacterium]
MRLAAEHTHARHHIGELLLAALPSELGAARAFAERVGVAFGLDGDDCYDFTYAVNEAVTNAIRHGAPDRHGRIHLSFRASASRLTIAVRDYGTFVMPVARSDARSEHGRGFPLMARLTDAVRVRVEPGRTTVYLSKARA